MNVFLKERLQKTESEHVDDFLWERRVPLSSREVPVSRARENEMAQILDKIDFKASNGWLEHFKNQTQRFQGSVTEKQGMRSEWRNTSR
jgi:hypothetical protein